VLIGHCTMLPLEENPPLLPDIQLAGGPMDPHCDVPDAGSRIAPTGESICPQLMLAGCTPCTLSEKEVSERFVVPVLPPCIAAPWETCSHEEGLVKDTDCHPTRWAPAPPAKCAPVLLVSRGIVDPGGDNGIPGRSMWDKSRIATSRKATACRCRIGTSCYILLQS